MNTSKHFSFGNKFEKYTNSIELCDSVISDNIFPFIKTKLVNDDVNFFFNSFNKNPIKFDLIYLNFNKLELTANLILNYLSFLNPDGYIFVKTDVSTFNSSSDLINLNLQTMIYCDIQNNTICDIVVSFKKQNINHIDFSFLKEKIDNQYIIMDSILNNFVTSLIFIDDDVYSFVMNVSDLECNKVYPNPTSASDIKQLIIKSIDNKTFKKVTF
jgi:hypothetical protein